MPATVMPSSTSGRGGRKQRQKQAEAGKIDAGSRGDVTGGGHMGALELLVKELLIEFGINESDIFTKQKLELPGLLPLDEEMGFAGGLSATTGDGR